MYYFKQKFRYGLWCFFFGSAGVGLGAIGLFQWVWGRGDMEIPWLFACIVVFLTFSPLLIWDLIRLFSKKPDVVIDEKGIFFRNYFIGKRLIPWAVIGRVYAHQEIFSRDFGPLLSLVLDVYPKDHDSCVRRNPKDPPIPPYNWLRRGPPYRYIIRYHGMDLPAIKAAIRQRGGLRKG